MKSGKILFLFLILAPATGCGGGGSGRSSALLGGGNPPTENNVLPITVNSSLCSSSSTPCPNKPCSSMTICTPGTATCQTINGILLDTGSSGLWIFKQVLNVSRTQVTSGSDLIAACVQYGAGSSDGSLLQEIVSKHRIIPGTIRKEIRA